MNTCSLEDINIISIFNVMQFKFEIEKFSDHAVIRTSGDRKTVSDYISGTNSLYDTIVESGRNFVLADYRDVRFHLNLTEAFNMVRMYERKLPKFKSITMAIVINPHTRDFAGMWEEISLKKGFDFKIFENFDSAKEWVMKKIAKSKKK